jgi:tetratricopeptide (TPR) repeat protein
VAQLNKSGWRNLIGATDDSSLETKWMAAELFDYAGQYIDAKKILSESGPQAIENLTEALHSRDPRQCIEGAYRHRYKQHSLIAIQWGFTFYRMNEYRQAKEVWDVSREFVEKWLNSKDYPCHGTLSRLLYGMGLVHRQRYEYGEARRMFRESIDHAQLDFQWHMSAKSAKGTLLLEYRIAKCLGLGLGWVCYTEGSLDLAAILINQSRVLLANKNVKMIKAYVDIVQAEVQISEKGDQRSQLDEAIDTLHKAYDLLACHPAYRARTAHELALAHIRLSMLCLGPEKTRQLEKAKELIEEVKKFSKRDPERKKEDERWGANSLIAEARLYRMLGKYQVAKRAAEDALAKSKNDRFARIDALIELGQALMGSASEDQDDGKASEDYRSALDHFEKALTDASENPKSQAVCHLHIARCHLGLHAGNRALEHVEKWRALSPRVTNAFVRRLAKVVDDEVAKFKLPFTINWPVNVSEMPDVGDEEKRLHGWVTEVAESLAGPGKTKDAFKLVKRSGKVISRATFFNWREEAGLSNGKDKSN